MSHVWGVSFWGAGGGPEIRSVETTPDLRTLLVTFTEEMTDNADLVNPAAYLLSGGARVVSAARVNGTQVVLRTARDLRNETEYLLTVDPNP